MKTKLLKRLRKESCRAYWATVDTDGWGVSRVRIIGPDGAVRCSEQWTIREVMEKGLQDYIQRTLTKHRQDYILAQAKEIRLEKFANALIKKLDGRIG